METSKARTVGIAVGSLVLAGSGLFAAAPALAEAQSVQAAESTVADCEGSSSQSGIQQVANMEGLFSFDQNTVTPIDRIAGMFRTAASAVCASIPDYGVAQTDQGIAIGGSAAQNAFAATIDEMADEDGAQTFIMGCACSANGPGGGAIVNAEVSGVSLESIIEMAEVE